MYKLTICILTSLNYDKNSGGEKDYGESSQGLQQMEGNDSVLHT